MILNLDVELQEHDSEYMEYQNRVRPRYDYPDPMHEGARYRGSFSCIRLSQFEVALYFSV